MTATQDHSKEAVVTSETMPIELEVEFDADGELKTFAYYPENVTDSLLPGIAYIRITLPLTHNLKDGTYAAHKNSAYPHTAGYIRCMEQNATLPFAEVRGTNLSEMLVALEALLRGTWEGKVYPIGHRETPLAFPPTA